MTFIFTGLMYTYIAIADILVKWYHTRTLAINDTSDLISLYCLFKCWYLNVIHLIDFLNVIKVLKQALIQVL